MNEARQSWRTPPELFHALHDIFQFTVDACASSENALLPTYWTAEDNCVLQDWSNHVVFCNPPFALGGRILPKAATAKTAVFLLPVNSLTTKYLFKTPPDSIGIPSYRIKFVPADASIQSGSPAMGTMMLFYNATSDQLDLVKDIGIAIYTASAF